MPRPVCYERVSQEAAGGERREGKTGRPGSMTVENRLSVREQRRISLSQEICSRAIASSKFEGIFEFVVCVSSFRAMRRF